MSIMVVSATESKVLIDGNELAGLQSIDFKVDRQQVDVATIGLGERQTVIEAGQLLVTGTLRISSLNTWLDDLLYSVVPLSFNMVVELRKAGDLVRKLTFDECYLDDKSFNMDAAGVGLTVYNFTATRVREE
ncbi:MAG: hypothetical protein ACETVR_02820 [Candidatus Bathyarchaeia archaeon]